MHLVDLVNQAFGANGAIVQLGGRYVREQHQYALSVVDVLMNPDSALGVIEAETGVGKGLGYIIPCLLFLATNDVGEQIIISTFTRLLQKQLLHKDLPFAVKVVEHIGLKAPPYAYRMGRQAFFSIERTKHTVERLKARYSANKQYTEVLDQFMEYAVNSASHGSGLWLDWLDEYSEFPELISSRDICMLYSGSIDNDAYISHINKSCDAKFLITNHATVIGNDNISDFVESAYLLIVDEAHHLPRIMTERANKVFSMSSLQYIFQNSNLVGADPSNLSDITKILEAWIGLVKKYDKDQGHADEFYVSSNGHKVWLEGQVDYVLQFIIGLRKIQKAAIEYETKNPLNATQVEYFESLESAIMALEFWVNSNDFFYRAFVFQGAERNINFAVINPIASRLFAHVCSKLTGRVLITSATLFDRKDSNQAPSIIGDLGFSKQAITTVASFSPTAYGEMKFVLPSQDIPIPTSYDKEKQCNRFNVDWLDYTANMIIEASKTGKCLVLTYSFEETKLISDRLNEIKAISQEKGKKLLEYMPSFINGDAQVLLTPSGWDGLNIRTSDDRQLLKNVIITRLPNSPKNDLEDFVAREFMLSKDMPLHVVDDILWLKHVHYCIRVLRQGIGRGIRSPNDSVFTWFADPRMPQYNSPKAKPLINAIPERFLSNYRQAVIYLADGSFDTGLADYAELDLVF